MWHPSSSAKATCSHIPLPPHRRPPLTSSSTTSLTRWALFIPGGTVISMYVALLQGDKMFQQSEATFGTKHSHNSMSITISSLWADLCLVMIWALSHCLGKIFSTFFVGSSLYQELALKTSLLKWSYLGFFFFFNLMHQNMFGKFLEVATTVHHKSRNEKTVQHWNLRSLSTCVLHVTL